MRYTAFLATVAASALTAGVALAAEGDTLAQVKQRDVLNCGVNTGLVGFAAPDANGNWSGFDVAFCKAVAAAVLGDATKVKYVPTTGQTRFTALSSGEVDLLARNSTMTFQRDTDLKMDFAGVNYYNGQGFMVRKDLGVSSATELDGATVSWSNPEKVIDEQRAGREVLNERTAWRVFGAAAYGVGRLASGAIDLAVESGTVGAYDICSFVPIIEGAGGVVTDGFGAPVTTATTLTCVAAATPELHEEAIRVLNA